MILQREFTLTRLYIRLMQRLFKRLLLISTASPMQTKFAKKRIDWLLNKNILKNLILVIFIDLQDPREITQQYIKWTKFINSQLLPLIESLLDEESRESMDSLQNEFLKINELLRKHKPHIEPLMLYQSPLILIGTKFNSLELRNDEHSRNYVEYKMRDFSLKSHSPLIFFDEREEATSKRLFDFLLSIKIQS